MRNRLFTGFLTFVVVLLLFVLISPARDISSLMETCGSAISDVLNL